MCGIFGLLNGEKFSSQLGLDKFLTAGCVTGVLRGGDSTGVYQVLDTKAVRIHKKPMCGFDFAQLRATQGLFSAASRASATIIHHRAATHGEVTLENCHPFEHTSETKYLVGVHNGTVPQFRRKEDNLHFDVDSDWLYYQVLKHGAPKALGSLDESASYAMVWYDQDEDKHCIAANGKRTISWGFVKGKNLMLIASEHSHLYWLADRYDLTIEEEIWSPQPGFVYKFDTDDLRAYATDKIEARPPQPQTQYNWPTSTGAAGSPMTNTVGDMSIVSNNTETHTVRLDYRSAALHSEGLQDQAKKYHFWPEAASLWDTAPFPRIVRGLLVDPDNEEKYWDGAVLLKKERFDDFSTADYVEVRAIGVRSLTDKASAVITKQIYCTGSSFVVEQPPTTLYRGPRGRNLTKDQYVKMVGGGCVCCACPLGEEDQDSIEWVNSGTDPLCKGCVSDRDLGVKAS